MKRFVLSLVLVLATALAAAAQTATVNDSRPLADSITAASSAQDIIFGPLNGRGTVTIHTTGTWTGTYVVQGSLDNNCSTATYVNIPNVTSITSNTIRQVATSGIRCIKIPASGWGSGTTNFRLQASTASIGGGGSATASLTLQETDDASIAGGQTADAMIGLGMAFDGSVWRRITFGSAGTPSSQVWSVQGVSGGTALPASQSGTWSTRTQDGSGNAVTSSTEGSYQPIHVAIVNPDTNALATLGGACTMGSFISAATVNETAIKATTGYLDGLWVASLDATPVYVKLYNDTTANIDETDTPTARFMVPSNSTAANGSGNNLVPPGGAYFSTAITLRTTTGIADNDTGALTANEVLVTYCYR